jgi:hypothetical protein
LLVIADTTVVVANISGGGTLAATTVGSGVLTRSGVGLVVAVVVRSGVGLIVAVVVRSGVGLLIAAAVPVPVPIMPRIAVQLTIEANRHARGVPIR